MSDKKDPTVSINAEHLDHALHEITSILSAMQGLEKTFIRKLQRLEKTLLKARREILNGVSDE